MLQDNEYLKKRQIDPSVRGGFSKAPFNDFEVMFIDDQSTDHSFEIIKNLSNTDNRFRVIQTPTNLGNAAKVLKYGFDLVKSDYFVYSSQDDLYSVDWLSCMYARAVATNADATIPDLVFYHPTSPERERKLVGVNGNKEIILSGRSAFLHSLNWTIPGNALWKTCLIKKIGWFDFGMNADEYSVRVFFLNCEKVVFSEGIFYYRQNNPEAITKKISIQSFDTPYTEMRLWLLAKSNDFDVTTQLYLLHRSITMLMGYIFLAYFGSYKQAIPVIKKTFDEYNDNNVRKWLKINNINKLNYRVNEISIKSYALLVMFSFIMTTLRRLLGK